MADPAAISAAFVILNTCMVGYLQAGLPGEKNINAAAAACYVAADHGVSPHDDVDGAGLAVAADAAPLRCPIVLQHRSCVQD